MEDKFACLLEGLWSAWNKSVQICGICGRLIYLWEIIIRGRLLSVEDKNYHPWERLIIRGSAFIRGEKGIIRGVIWCNGTPNTWGIL